MAATTDLVTLNDLKAQLAITTTDDDPRLEAIINVASEIIENHCNRRFAQTLLTEYYDGRGSRRILLDRPPIASGTTPLVYDKGSDDSFTAAEDLIDADDCEYYADRGEIYYRESTFDNYHRNVKVIYTGGYAAGSIPMPVQQACVILVEMIYTRTKRHGWGIRSEGINDYRVQYLDAAIPPTVVALLAPYRLTDRTNG